MTMQEDDKRLQPPTEQIVYANILTFGVWFGLAIMTIFYCLYVFGVIKPHVELARLTENWGNDVHTYLLNTHTPNGWGWLKLVSKGDFMNYLGFGFLALLTNACFIVLMVGYVKRKDWLYAAISLTEVVVLTLAASGIFGSGAH